MGLKHFNIVSLSLANNLRTLSCVEITKIITAMPSFVKALDLGSNELSLFQYDELREILASIPSHVQTLDLHRNELVSFGKDTLIKIFQSIPKSVTELRLSDNHFTTLSDSDFSELMENIPSHITSLDLSNMHDVYNSEIVRERFENNLYHLPSIPSLNLSGNHLAKSDKAIQFQKTRIQLASLKEAGLFYFSTNPDERAKQALKNPIPSDLESAVLAYQPTRVRLI